MNHPGRSLPAPRLSSDASLPKQRPEIPTRALAAPGGAHLRHDRVHVLIVDDQQFGQWNNELRSLPHGIPFTRQESTFELPSKHQVAVLLPCACLLPGQDRNVVLTRVGATLVP